MGNVQGCLQSSQDKEVSKLGRLAVGANQDQVSNEILEASINNAMSASDLKQKLELSFEASNLPNLDVGSKSDPFLVLWSLQAGGRKMKLGETEMVADTLEPKWIKTIDVNYFFEQQQSFVVEVYDADEPDRLHDLKAQEFIGKFEFQLSKLVSSPNQELSSKLTGASGNRGEVKIFAREKKAQHGQTMAILEFDLNTSSNSDLFCTISKQRGPNSYQPVFKTEVKSKLQNRFSFNMVSIDTDTLCGGEYSTEILLQVWIYNSSGNHKKADQISFTLGQLQEAGQPTQTLRGKKGYDLHLKKFQLQPRVSFLDYIFGGCEIGVHVAIDYTLSNGEPTQPGSLHYLNPNTMRNEYTDAISSVLNVLSDYDTDQMFPAFGFGARFQDKHGASHCFALNGDIFSPECNGSNGVLEAYYKSLSRMQLYGPTNFHNVLELVNGYATNSLNEISQQNQKYTICLIITDGVITDTEQTIAEIVKGSNLPLSIIIVGVGGADFSQMEVLDGDEKPLYSRVLNKYRDRDIVQFVPFREVHKDPIRLAREVLAEVPKQLVDYFTENNIKPNPPLMADRQQILIRNKMKNQIATMMRVEDEFFGAKKREFLQLFPAEMQPRVKEMIESVGVAEMDYDYIMQNLNNPQFGNPLKF